MSYSPSAWLGALIGIMVAVALSLPAIHILDRHLRDEAASGAAARERAEGRLSLLRRLILGLDIAILGALGYWIGGAIGAAGAARPLR